MSSNSHAMKYKFQPLLYMKDEDEFLMFLGVTTLR